MKIAVNGYKGKMGSEIVRYLEQSSAYSFVSGVDLGDDLEGSLKEFMPDVLIDFTCPDLRMQTILTALSNGVSLVVGTTGFTHDDLKQVDEWVRKFSLGCFIAPNFIIGNVLMQEFAKKAASHYENAEIIEYHHEQKVDYPSGTAVKTAELMSENRRGFNKNTADKVANINGARGGDFNGIKIHAVRMPGFIASQEVVLGEEGEYLTIRHDSINRRSYMKGIFMAVDYIVKNPKLVYGLENIL